jgi:two-component sensor histidine kinase
MAVMPADDFTPVKPRNSQDLENSNHRLVEDEDFLIGSFDAPSVADKRQDQLSDELHHRVQNTLAIVLALARLTARSCKTIEQFQLAFSDRVQAMARTNALLLRGKVQAIDVRAAIELELEPWANLDGSVSLECEHLLVTPDAALSFSLLVHELATNAAKYGGLSKNGGSLMVRCERRPAGGALIWHETSPGFEPRELATGAGSLLIRRLALDLGGSATLDMRPEGLHAEITFALCDMA